MRSLPRRIVGLFRRYTLANDLVRGRAGAIRHGGRTLGRTDALERDGARLRVAGKLHAQAVTLRLDSRVATVTRPEGLAPDAPLRFDLALPVLGGDDAGEGPRLTWIGDGGDEGEMPLRFPGPVRVRAGHLAGFAWALVRLVPTLVGWLRTHDPRHRGTVKRVLGLDRAARFQPLDPRVLPERDTPPERAETPGSVTILLPVHNGFDLLEECLGRVVRHTDLPWRLVVIEDGSTDPRVRPFLRDWAAGQGARTQLIEPPENLGFVGAVNAGLAAIGVDEGTAPDAPVVLLNSDAFVPAGWASRLLAPLADPSVASVTPMSNDAEITTAPVICVRHDLPAGAADAIDTAAARLDAGAAQADMPTGVGFCMALSPAFLSRLPRLDAVFGRGYGEEVDWCQKARALGGRHIGLGSLFVEHRGGASFGSAAKAALIAKNGALISARYPTYDLEVQQFLAADPLTTPRLALALAWAGATAPAAVPVYMAHDMGGGAEIWLMQRIATDLEAGLPSVVLRVGGPARWQLEVHAQGGVTGAAGDDWGVITRLLDLLPTRRLVYSCGVGDPDAVALPDLLLGLRRPGDGLEVLLHDWFPISPSYTLLDADGVYRGPVGPDRADPAHRMRRPDGRVVTLPEWQAAWGRLMRAADRVRVFSPDGRAQLAAAYPDVTGVEVRGHPMPDLAGLAMALPDTPAAVTHAHVPPVIGLIGNLNLHKGAGVVAALGRRIGTPGGPAAVVVLGQVDPETPLPARVKVHGGYSVAQIPALARTYGITHWLMPAIWPETFSYATHEALATGLPVLAFDIGAQGAAVAAAPLGRVVPLVRGGDAAQAVLDALAPGPGTA